MAEEPDQGVERPTAPAEAERDAGGRSLPAPPRCDVCGAPMYERHCRILCARCGYQRDCSDP